MAQKSHCFQKFVFQLRPVVSYGVTFQNGNVLGGKAPEALTKIVLQYIAYAQSEPFARTSAAEEKA